MEIISRKEALKVGSKRYFTGKPCIRGHIAERYLRSKCVECAREDGPIWRKNNPEATRNIFLKWKQNNLEHYKDLLHKWDKENVEKRRQISSNFYKRNPHKNCARQTKREAAKMKRMPIWADKEKIESIYLRAAKLTKESGIEYQVDHIIPLQGKNVSGLHVESNLQVITKRENVMKSNLFII